jgi:hypothetical protein
MICFDKNKVSFEILAVLGLKRSTNEFMGIVQVCGAGLPAFIQTVA